MTEITVFQIIENILNMINHISIGFMTIYFTWTFFKAEITQTAIHGWLCGVGYILLMAEAMMCFYSGNYFLNGIPRRNKATIHWILQVIGSAMTIFGIIYKYYHKSVHFKTIHGITGLISTILLCFGLLSGLSALYSQNLRNLIAPINSKIFHISMGLMTFIIGMISLYYGYDTGFFKRRVLDREFIGWLKAITIVIIALTSYGPVKSLYGHIRNRWF